MPKSLRRKSPAARRVKSLTTVGRFTTRAMAQTAKKQLIASGKYDKVAIGSLSGLSKRDYPTGHLYWLNAVKYA